MADTLTSYVPTSNVTLYAVWAKLYTITIKIGDNIVRPNTYEEGDYLSSLDSTMDVDGTRKPITGWKDEATGKIYNSSELLGTPIKASNTYIAQYDEDDTYQVTVVKNDGTNEKSVISVEKGDSLVEAFHQAAYYLYYREGYKELGWSLSSDADWTDPGSYFTTDGAPDVTKDMTIYCVWGPLSSITYNANGGKMVDSGKTTYTTDKEYCGYVVYENVANDPSSECTRDGYALAGWSTDPKASEAQKGFTPIYAYDAYLNITKDTTLYAVWKKGCSITLDYNGGKRNNYSADTKQLVQVASGKTVSEALEGRGIIGQRNGYVLEGWSTDKSANNPVKTTAQMAEYKPTANETWYAVWKPIKTGTTHTVYFCANGGNVAPNWNFESSVWDSSGYWAYIPNGRSINDMMDQNGSDYGINCVKEGYILAGWSRKSNATTADYKTAEELGAFKPTADTTLYAVWKPLKLSLSKTSLTVKTGRKIKLNLSASPTYAWDGSRVVDNAYYFNSNRDVLGNYSFEPNEFTAKHEGKAVITVSCGGQSVQCLVTVTDGDPAVIYKTHVQRKGTMDWVENGALSGTTGQSLRMEALYIDLADAEYPGLIEYRAHVQRIGWQDWSANGALAGTEGQSLRLEAVQIKLTGEMAKHYDIYYCVHAQHYGWLNWAKNGQSSGTAGYGYRLEALKVVLVKKGAAAPAKIGTDTAAFHQKSAVTKSSVTYRSHVQTYGDQKWVSDGAMSGTQGEYKRMEAVYIKLASQTYTGGIEYQSHVQTYGWEKSWVKNGKMSGTSGKAKRLEAIRIRLTGEMAKHYDVYYRVHAQHFGWLGWAKNGASAGTAGFGYRLEAIEIKLVPKGHAAPGSTANTFKQK